MKGKRSEIKRIFMGNSVAKREDKLIEKIQATINTISPIFNSNPASRKTNMLKKGTDLRSKSMDRFGLSPGIP